MPRIRLDTAALVVAAGMAVAMLATGSAHANQQSGVTKVLRTNLPNWQVGDIDKKLSQLCSMGQFNQRTPYKYSGHFYGPTGAAMVGGAKGSGLNLWDPTGAANQQRDYWFHRDRTSACIVFWAPVRPGNGLPATPAAQPTR